MLLWYAQISNASFYLEVSRYAFRHDCVILRRGGEDVHRKCTDVFFYKNGYLNAKIYLCTLEV
jgi:hypothetical protein